MNDRRDVSRRQGNPGGRPAPKKNNTKKILLWTIIVLAVAGIGVGVYSLISAGAQSEERAQADAALRDQVISEPVAQPTPIVIDEQPPETEPQELSEVLWRADEEEEEAPWWEDYVKSPDREIDFEELQAINPDVYAWIYIPGTEIDYPIVHSAKGDGKYLNMDIEGNGSKHGAIFTDGHNQVGFSDPLTLVYGHNMKDGSMFAQLHNFEDAAFFDEYSTIKVYTPDGLMEYEIIAANKVGDEHILALNDFTDDEVFAEYLEGIYEVRDLNANLRETELTTDDRLIVLSTCVSGEDDKRYFVQGRLKENE